MARPKGNQEPVWDEPKQTDTKKLYWWERVVWDEFENEIDICPAYRKGTQTITRSITISKETARRIEIIMEALPIRLRTFSDAIRALIEFAIGPLYYLLVIRKNLKISHARYWYEQLKRMSRVHHNTFILDTFLEEASILQASMQKGHISPDRLEELYIEMVNAIPDDLKGQCSEIATSVLSGRTGGKIMPFLESSLSKRSVKTKDNYGG